MMSKQQKVTLDEIAEVIGREVRKAGDKYFDLLHKTDSSYPLGDTELGGKAKNCAEKNITFARDYFHRLTHAVRERPKKRWCHWTRQPLKIEQLHSSLKP
jgi:hypothetical protein